MPRIFDNIDLCPKNLVSMWEDYVHRYRRRAGVLSISRVLQELPEKMRRHRVVLIDESHHLRNREGQRWRTIRDYVERNESLCILLSATPYNKTYLDLSTQLGLFLREDADLGIRPEKLIARLGGEHEFIRRHQCPVRSLAAFGKSDDPDDWRDLFVTDAHLREIDRALEEVCRYPLYPTATDALNRQIRAGIGDHRPAELVRNLREDGRLCVIDAQESQREPKLICTLGLA